jgi:hypothetical protein
MSDQQVKPAVFPTRPDVWKATITAAATTDRQVKPAVFH